MNYRALTLLMVSVLPFYLTGCETLDAYFGKENSSSPAKGDVSAAGTGALPAAVSTRDKSSSDLHKGSEDVAGDGALPALASITDKSRRDRRKAILVGAGVGGISGAAIDSYMDKQEQKLRRQLEGTGVSVTRNGDNLVLNMPGNITFATGSADLKPSFNEVLNSVIVVLNEFNQTLIESAGHTDSVGTDTSNQNLSYNRSRSVGNYLIDNGINIDRVIMVGHGEERPISENKTAEGRQLNRRVELTLIPVQAGT